MKYVLAGLLGAAIVGSIGFAIGFFGPIVFYPSSPQGPLVGIFFTGPLGAVIGLVGGLIYAAVKKPSAKKNP